MKDKPTTAPGTAGPSAATDPLKAIEELAAACDRHAAALSRAVKELHSRITQARIANDGKGPTGLMITSVLERCWASYAAGTCLRSTRGALARQRTFKDQIAQWEKLLRPAPDPAVMTRTPSPMPPPSAA